MLTSPCEFHPRDKERGEVDKSCFFFLPAIILYDMPCGGKEGYHNSQQTNLHVLLELRHHNMSLARSHDVPYLTDGWWAPTDMHKENNSFVLGGVCYRACIVRYGSAVEWSIVVHLPPPQCSSLALASL